MYDNTTTNVEMIVRKSTTMENSQQIYIDWIREGLKGDGKTQSGLAHHLGIAHPQISRLLRGARSIKVHELPKIAEYLGSPIPGPEAVPVTARNQTVVRVVGTVDAGAFREVDEFTQEEFPEISADRDERFPHARMIAFDVAGDSMNDLKPRPILPGDRIIALAYDDIQREVPLRNGMTVVVERERDGGHMREWSVKEIQMFPDRTEFHPRSTNPRHKPIIIEKNDDPDNGETVRVIALVKNIVGGSMI